ncbi:uncharacterized protein cubi_01406 [Cryptosporidium ubiquitum]|uniref:Uncharacterized protein n=1 Tax=Cryptosporidium ubiquitum TaxID=857276 RepID=A0A1J4MCW4_9CRYT|nr:uncharacterized protein cubi_01406 [Cryptosporidium ubiquitum]OII72073.1 hypothetical protein cubi_01406 [Cryptosporidium ubiquitum]
MPALSRSITPINVHDYNQEDVNIVCISLIKGAEFKGNQHVGSIVDLSSNAHGLSLILPKLEISSGLYGLSLEPIIISSCKSAKILLTSPPNTKLLLLQPFIIFSCLEVAKQQVSTSQTIIEESKSLLKIDYSSLGSGIPFSKRPYECRFDSPTFAKDGSSINYKKKQVYWTCFSKVEELLVINLFSEMRTLEKILLSIVDDMHSPSNKISVKSPCNGTMHENKQGILARNQIFLRIECDEENLPKLLNSRDLVLRQRQLRKK